MTTGEKIVLGVIILLGVVFAMVTPLLRDRMDEASCAVRYADARTAADTARIDTQRSPMQRGSGGTQLRPATCGELRHQR